MTEPKVKAKKKENSAPGVLSWLIAALSSGLLVGTLFVADWITSGAYYAGLQQSFLNELRSSRSLSSVIQNKQYQPLLESSRSAAEKAARLMSLLEQHNYRSAKRLVSSPTFPVTQYTAAIREHVAALPDESVENSEEEESPEMSDVPESLQGAEEQIHGLLISLAKPKLSRHLVVTYNTARNFAKDRGYELPKLDAAVL